MLQAASAGRVAQSLCSVILFQYFVSRLFWLALPPSYILVDYPTLLKVFLHSSSELQRVGGPVCCPVVLPNPRRIRMIWKTNGPLHHQIPQGQGACDHEDRQKNDGPKPCNAKCWLKMKPNLSRSCRHSTRIFGCFWMFLVSFCVAQSLARFVALFLLMFRACYTSRALRVSLNARSAYQYIHLRSFGI